MEQGISVSLDHDLSSYFFGLNLHLFTYEISRIRFRERKLRCVTEPFPKTHEELNFCVFSVAIVGCEFVAKLIKDHPFIIFFIITLVIFHNIHRDKIKQMITCSFIGRLKNRLIMSKRHNL